MQHPEDLDPSTRAPDARPASVPARPVGRPSELPRRWRSMWLSELHLGASACRAELLLGLLKHFESEQLFLAGDVIAGPTLWDLQRWDPVHGAVVRALVERAQRSRVVYVTGRDDGFERRHAGRALGGVEMREEAVHATADGRELLVKHQQGRDIALHGTRGGLFGRGIELVRSAVTRRDGETSVPPGGGHDVECSERELAGEVRRRGLDGVVVCGHVHRAGIRELDGVLYCNSGDWIESCTALVEDVRGKLALLRLSALGALCATAGAG